MRRTDGRWRVGLTMMAGLLLVGCATEESEPPYHPGTWYEDFVLERRALEAAESARAAATAGQPAPGSPAPSSADLATPANDAPEASPAGPEPESGAQAEPKPAP